jgi:hypothetical protein
MIASTARPQGEHVQVEQTLHANTAYLPYNLVRLHIWLQPVSVNHAQLLQAVETCLGGATVFEKFEATEENEKKSEEH